MEIVHCVHLAATLFMAGVIWVVQVVHYPLFALVGAVGFSRYAQSHAEKITYVVLPAMLAELASSVALVAWAPRGQTLLPAAGLALVGLIWASTFFIQVPLHTRLAEGFDEPTHRRLVATNWVRTGLWSIRAVLAFTLALSLFTVVPI